MAQLNVSENQVALRGLSKTLCSASLSARQKKLVAAIESWKVRHTRMTAAKPCYKITFKVHDTRKRVAREEAKGGSVGGERV